MSEKLIVWMSAGIVLFIGGVNVVLTLYTWRILGNIQSPSESNIYLNTEALDLERLKDALKRIAQDTVQKGTQDE